MHVGTLLKLHLQEEKIRKKYQAIIEKSFDGFLTTGADSKITYSCPSTCDLTGLSEQQLINKNISELLHPDDGSDFQRQFNELVNGQASSLTMRKRLNVTNGPFTWVEIKMMNMLNARDVNCVVYYITNIAAIVDRERQQEDFVNIASHELKNPITAIQGYLQLIKRRSGESNEDLNKVMKRMEAQLLKMQNIVGAMLDNTKIRSGEIQYDFRQFDLNECIRDTIDAVKVNNDSHEVSCSFESPERLILGDEEKISRVLTNLISNAIKYSPEGKGVELVTTMESGFIKVKITDHGIGIAKEKQAHLFERFYRVDTLPKHLSGLGLGLFIAAHIVYDHAGSIGVESIPGDGSSFWFTLPLANQKLNTLYVVS